MKINILQENLQKVLAYLQKAIPNKPQLPILSSILVETKDNKLHFSATDLYLGIKTHTIAEIEQEGKIVIPGDIFKQLISSLNAEKVTIEVKGNNIKVKSQNSLVNLPIQSAEDYPSFPLIEGDFLELPTEIFKQIYKFITFAVSNDQTRPILTAVLFKFNSEGLEVVGTDGFRLANYLFPETKLNKELTVLVPMKAVREVARIATQTESEKISFLVSKELKQLKFIINGTQIFVRLIEGDYPPYQKIIPADFKIQLEIDGGSLEAELKRAFILARDSSNIIKFQIEEDFLKISSASPSIGQYEGIIPVKNLSKETGEIAFNARYLLDFFAAVKPDHIWFGMNESLTPAMFKSSDDKSYQYVVMPFRVNN